MARAARFQAVAVVLAALSAVLPGHAAPATDAVIAEVGAAIDAGDAAHAKRLADETLRDGEIAPLQRGRLLLDRGLAQELLGAHREAMADFTAALGTRALPANEHAQALLQRGFLLDGMGVLDEAVRDYTAVIALKAGSVPSALNNRANIYRRQNRLIEARRDYQASLQAGNAKPQFSYYGLGQIAETQHDTIAARGFYARAVAADPGYRLAADRLAQLGGPPEGALAEPDEIQLRAPAPTLVATPAKPLKALARTPAPPPAKPITRPVLRPALDASAVSGGADVQLGAWRSADEARTGWARAKAHAAGVLDGLSPNIIAADVPGKGRFYRLRTAAPGQSKQKLCQALTAHGVLCLPVRD